MLRKLLDFNRFRKLAMAAATVAVLAYAVQWFTRPQAPNEDARQQGTASIATATPAAAAGTTPIPYRFDVDADTDGLPNALEFVYRTDTLRPDTDGDGYSDGSEVANGYDPTIAGSARLPEQPANLTQRYLAWANHPTMLDTSRVISFLGREPDLAFRLPDVNAAELRVSTTSNTDQLASYREAVAGLALPQGVESYNDLARDALADRFDATDRIAAELGELASSWQAREVPAQAKSIHAKLVGLLRLARELFTELHDAKTDPVRIIWNMERGRALTAVAQDIQREAAALK